MSIRARLALALCAAALAFASTAARAGIVYDEAVSGDLSNDGFAPTPVTLELGSNQVFGATGRVIFDPDRDYFNVTIPVGYVLVGLIELAGTIVNNQISFLAIQAGPQVTFDTSSVTANGLLGWTHYAGTTVDRDILAQVGAGGSGSTGFVPPLPAGDYAFWIQDTGDGNATYGFDLVVGVPEPGVAALLLLACGALAASRSRLSRA